MKFFLGAAAGSFHKFVTTLILKGLRIWGFSTKSPLSSEPVTCVPRGANELSSSGNDEIMKIPSFSAPLFFSAVMSSMILFIGKGLDYYSPRRVRTRRRYSGYSERGRGLRFVRFFELKIARIAADGEVLPLEVILTKHLHQLASGALALSEDHHTRSTSIDAVDGITLWRPEMLTQAL